MAHIYISRWKWNTGSADELAHWAAPGGDSVGLVDLRSLDQMGKSGGTPEGTGAFAYPTARVIPGSVYLGQDLNLALTAAQRTALKRAWGLSTLDSVTVRDALWDRLTIHTDPTGVTGPKPVRGRLGNPVKLSIGGLGIVREESFNAIHRQRAINVWMNDYRHTRIRVPPAVRQRRTGRFMLDMFGRMNNQLASLVLPSEFVGDGWSRPQTTITDDFNRADSDSLGANWTERQGDWDIVSNHLKNITSAGTANVAHHNTALSSADYFVQALVNVDTNTQHRGVCARQADFSTADSDLYAALLTGSGADYDFYKRVSGSWTKLDDQSQAHSELTDYTIKIQSNGTDHSSWFEGSLKTDAVSDSAISAAGKAGFVVGTRMLDRWDDFIAEDLATVETFPFSHGGDPLIIVPQAVPYG